MSLPQRLYYPLDKAAKELGCDVSDLIHFAANGDINICAKVFDSGEHSEDIISDWVPDLLINDTKLISLIRKHYIIKDEQFIATEEDFFIYNRHDLFEVEKGTLLYKDDIVFHYVNSYVKLFGNVHFTICKEDDEYSLFDYKIDLYEVAGLIQLSKFDFFYNEGDLILGYDINVKNFCLPIDDNEKITGCFSGFNNDFDDNDKYSFIDRDKYFMREESVSNRLSKKNEPVRLSINDMYLTFHEIDRIKNNENKKMTSSAVNIDVFDNPKSRATGEKFIKYLISLLPEFTEKDIESLSPTRIKLILEKIAAKRNVDICDIHSQTLARYLGHESGKR